MSGCIRISRVIKIHDSQKERQEEKNQIALLYKIRDNGRKCFLCKLYTPFSIDFIYNPVFDSLFNKTPL